jgi:hypothetical protein
MFTVFLTFLEKNFSELYQKLDMDVIVNELHPTFNVDGKPFTMKAWDKRTPGLFKIECMKDKIIALCSKMYCCSDMDEKELNSVVRVSKRIIIIFHIKI